MKGINTYAVYTHYSCFVLESWRQSCDIDGGSCSRDKTSVWTVWTKVALPNFGHGSVS